MNTVQPYVEKSDSDFVRVKIIDARIEEKLIGIGFTNDINLNEYKIATPNDEKNKNI